MCQLKSSNIVTKLMSEVDFVKTAVVGDVIEFGVEVTKIGKTSITLCCDVRNKNTKETITKVDRIIFVLLEMILCE